MQCEWKVLSKGRWEYPLEDESFPGGRGQILPPFPEVCKSSLGMPTFKLSMNIIYRIFSIKRRARIKGADKRKITNKRGTQSEQCGVYMRIMRKVSAQLRNLHNQDNYDSISAKKGSHWNSYTKHLFVYIIHVIYRGMWFSNKRRRSFGGR